MSPTITHGKPFVLDFCVLQIDSTQLSSHKMQKSKMKVLPCVMVIVNNTLTFKRISFRVKYFDGMSWLLTIKSMNASASSFPLIPLKSAPNTDCIAPLNRNSCRLEEKGSWMFFTINMTQFMTIGYFFISFVNHSDPKLEIKLLHGTKFKNLFCLKKKFNQ